MSVISKLMEKRNKSSTLSNPASWLTKIFGNMTSAGKNISEQKSLEDSAVWACVRILSEDLASLPLITYRRLEDGGKERARRHYLYKLLHDQPNSEMTAFTFKETLMAHALTWGNGYAEIEYDGSMKPKNLWPLLPDRTKPCRRNGELWYKTKIPGTGKQIMIPGYRIFHVHGLGFDGLRGYSVIRKHAESLGINLAAKEFGARFFGNDSRPGGVLQYDGKLDSEQKQNLKQSWEEAQGGLENKWRVAVLQHGIEWQQIGLPPEDAQFIETRKFQKKEIATIYRIPLHMLADMESGASYSSIEQQSINYVVNTLRPWLVRWEQQIDKDLFTGETADQYFAEFLVEGLLRGDIESRYSAYATGRQWGWLSANDVREKENMNPIDNGDIYLVPDNMSPAEVAAEMDEEDVPEELEDIRKKKKEIWEKRQRRKATERLEEEQKFKPLIERDMQEVVEREISNILRNARKHFGEEENSREKRDIEQWRTWLDDYYRDFPEYIQKEMEPVLNRLAFSIAEIAKEEVDFDEDITEEVDEFMGEYMEAFTARYVDSSKGQLVAMTNRLEEGELEEDMMTEIENRMDRWEETRASNQSMIESTQLGNAVALTAFASAGVVAKVWENTGSDTCPFCEELDGMTVGLDKKFIPADGKLEAEEEDHSINIFKPIGHPPVHLSCVCQIVPE